jgi:hypothetical protein
MNSLRNDLGITGSCSVAVISRSFHSQACQLPAAQIR